MIKFDVENVNGVTYTLEMDTSKAALRQTINGELRYMGTIAPRWGIAAVELCAPMHEGWAPYMRVTVRATKSGAEMDFHITPYYCEAQSDVDMWATTQGKINGPIFNANGSYTDAVYAAE